MVSLNCFLQYQKFIATNDYFSKWKNRAQTVKYKIWYHQINGTSYAPFFYVFIDSYTWFSDKVSMIKASVWIERKWSIKKRSEILKVLDDWRPKGFKSINSNLLKTGLKNKRMCSPGHTKRLKRQNQILKTVQAKNSQVRWRLNLFFWFWAGLAVYREQNIKKERGRKIMSSLLKDAKTY